MVLPASNFNIVHFEPPFSFGTGSFLQRCPDLPLLEQADLSSITPQSLRTAKKIEFFCRYKMEWFELSPKTFGVLMNMGLTEERLELLGTAYASSSEPTLESYVSKIIKYVDVLYRERLKNRGDAKEGAEAQIKDPVNLFLRGAQIFWLERGTVLESTARSEDEKDGAKLTPAEHDSSITSGILEPKDKSSEFWHVLEATNNRRIHSLVAYEENCLIEGNRPLVLILETFGPKDTSFFRATPFNLHLMSALFKVFNVCTRSFSSAKELRSKMRMMTKMLPTQIVIIKGHGADSGYGIETYPDPLKAVSLYERLNSGFEFLAPNATVVLDGCYLGKGKSTDFNFANHLANSVPRGTHIVASERSHALLWMNLKEQPPYSTLFRTDREYDLGEVDLAFPTYHIDTGNPDSKLCPLDQISVLDLCNDYPLLRLKESKDKTVAVYFYSARKKSWFEVSNEDWNFLRHSGMNNTHLQIISESPLTLSEFIERAKKNPNF